MDPADFSGRDFNLTPLRDKLAAQSLRRTRLMLLPKGNVSEGIDSELAGQSDPYQFFAPIITRKILSRRWEISARTSEPPTRFLTCCLCMPSQSIIFGTDRDPLEPAI